MILRSYYLIFLLETKRCRIVMSLEDWMVIGCTRNQLRTLPRRGDFVDGDKNASNAFTLTLGTALLPKNVSFVTIPWNVYL